MNNSFINRCQSYYSLLDSTISIDRLLDFSIQTGNEYVFLVDKDVSSSIEFYCKSIDKGLKPIIGIEIIYKNNKYILVAKNDKGYHNIVRISSYNKTNHDYDLFKYLDGVLVIFDGDDTDLLNSNFYHINQLAINNVKYLTKNEKQSYRVLHGIAKNMLLADIKDDGDFHFLSNQEAIDIYGEQKIIKTFEILKQCVLYLEKSKINLPKFCLPKNISSRKYLEKLCIDGLIKKMNIKDGLIEKKYVDRLRYEIAIIDKMNFNDYFLIVQDFVNYAKSKNILVGPGRGSAAGSLVSYALNITDVDPIKNNLIFERFLNPDRKSLPDIDIDVMDTRRQELIDYIFGKYGKENTCYIATFQRIKSKMAIRDVGRCLGIDLKIIDTITKLLTPDCDNDLINGVKNNNSLNNFYENYKNLFIIAASIINIPRQVSTHAAGIIICSEEITNHIGVQLGIDNWFLSQPTMEYIEKVGLIKIDILGLKNLSIIGTIVDQIKNKYQQDVDLSKIDFNDKKLFNEISQANTIGIFQLESPGMRSTLRKVKVDSIEDISIVSALFRPGPQAMIPDYVKTKRGELDENYINKNLKPILKPTLGFCIYQEQVIELIKSVSGFSTAEADIFRRAISKKKEDIFEQMRKPFVDGAIKNNYTNEQANKIFDFLLEFANYGFNHSHSLSYAYISYQMMFLKYYYPLEFYLTLLKYGDSSNNKNDFYINEAKKSGLKIFNVSMTKSNINFSDFNNGIIFGFSNVKGIGIEIAKKIIIIREKNDFSKDYISVISHLSVNGISRRIIEILIKIGAFDEYNVDREYLLINLDEIIENASFKISDKFIFGLDLKQNEVKMDEKQKSAYEYQYLSYSFSNNKYNDLFIKFRDEYNLMVLDAKTINHEYNYLVNIKSVKLATTKYNKKMLFIRVETDLLSFEITCFNQNIIDNIKPNSFAVTNLNVDKNGKISLTKILSYIG